MEKIPTSTLTSPNYDTWVILFDEKNNRIGYTHTQKEADDICIKNSKISWEEATIIIKSKEERMNEYKRLTKFTIHDF